MELQQIRKGNIFDVDNGLMLRMRVKRFFVDENGVDSVIIGSTTSLMEDESACPVSMLEGVPITEEILGDLGFEWEFTSGYWRYREICVIENGKLGYSALLTPLDYSLSVPLPYVHTLQNLYYAITATELPIKVAHFEIEEPQNTHSDYVTDISSPAK